MSNDVWVIHTVNSTLDTDFIGEMYVSDHDAARDFAHRNAKGEALPSSAFSKRVFPETSQKHTLRHITKSGTTVYLISPEFTKVLREFDMGRGNFYPATFFAKDRETPLDLHHMYWNFGNVKDSILLEHSPAAKNSRLPVEHSTN